MKYEKQALTFEVQADQLMARGLDADRKELVQRLSAVSYYRLAGYRHPYRVPDDQGHFSDQFYPGTSLTEVWRRYCFDRRLRGLVMDAIERIEVSVRTQLVYHFAHEHGPFGFCAEANIPKLKAEEYIDWRKALIEETRRSKEPFKKHFQSKYGGDHPNLPLWMVAELMSMGSLLTFFRGVSPDLKRKVATTFELPDEVMLSWLRSLNSARNICAHHARLWNRVLGYPPLLPSAKYPDWHGEFKLPNNRSGVLLMICRHLLKTITPTSRWHERVEALFDEYEEIPAVSMGMLPNWRSHPVWRG